MGINLRDLTHKVIDLLRRGKNKDDIIEIVVRLKMARGN